MSRRKIVFIGDCLATALMQVYRDFVAPLTGDNVRLVGTWHPTEANLRAIAEADIVVSQVFNMERKVTAAGMRPGALKIEFPAVFIGFLWPFSGRTGHTNNAPGPHSPDGPYGPQIGDTFLNKLVEDGVEPRAALEKYLAFDIARAAHLDRLFELHIGAQATRDEKTGFDFARIIETRFRDTQLFLTSSHPTLALLTPLFRGVFERLGVPAPITEAAIRAQRMPPFRRTTLPIHPGVIRHYGLRYVDETSRYPYMDEGSFTFEEFVLRYMAYASNDELLEGLALSFGPELERAHATLERALEKSPESAPGWRSKSRVLRRMRRPHEARHAAARAVALEPDDPEGPCELARTLIDSDDLAGAEGQARRAIELFPAEHRSHLLLAEILSAMARPDEAIAAARQAVAVMPADAPSYLMFARYLGRAGKLLEAEAAARRAADLAPSDPFFQNELADLLIRQGRLEAALEIVSKASGKGTRDAHLHARIGHLRRQAGDLAGAEAAVRQAIEIEPGIVGFHIALIDLVAGQGRHGEALEIADQAIARGMRDAHLFARAGQLRRQAGDLAGAEAAVRQAIEIEPGVAAFHHTLAELLAGQAPEATPGIVAGPAVNGAPEHGADVSGREQAFRQAIEIAPAAAILQDTPPERAGAHA